MTEEINPLLIRYFGDYVINTLQYNRLKLANPSQLNDPFELRFQVVGEMTDELKRIAIRQVTSGPQVYAKVREMHGEHLTDAEIFEMSKVVAQKAETEPLVDRDELIDGMVSTMLESADKNFRFLCFSDPSSEKFDDRSDILMWSHYGNAHAGFRLHFDTSFLGYMDRVSRFEINYRRLLEVPFELLIDDSKREEAILRMTESIQTKGAFWDYEQEIRYILPHPIPEGICDLSLEADFVYFPPQALKRVDVGIKTSDKLVSKLSEVLSAEQYEHVEVYQAKRHAEEMSIDYDRIKLVTKKPL